MAKNLPPALKHPPCPQWSLTAFAQLNSREAGLRAAMHELRSVQRSDAAYQCLNEEQLQSLHAAIDAISYLVVYVRSLRENVWTERFSATPPQG